MGVGAVYSSGMRPKSSGELHFPDGPKLELDELIDGLVERAHDVKRAQGRLRALLRAIDLVNADLSLEAVLHNIVEAACTLATARYAAIGVTGADGGLQRFIHVGVTTEQALSIGPLPQGKGLLGALITDPEPIRLTTLSDDPRSFGFPPNHPPMTSFLGVPLRVRGEVFGNLYLTESEQGQFSAEDEELVRSLALAAGSAIANARSYDDSRRGQQWLSASAEISERMLSETGEDPLRTIARSAHEIADADLVAVALVSQGKQDVLVEVAVGAGAEELTGRRFPLAAALAGAALPGKPPHLLQYGVEAEDRASLLSSVLEVGPAMVIPLVGADGILGVLSIARRRGAAAFSSSDLDMASGFAGHASVALEFASARADQQKMVLFEDRDRIARDLHDHVIQQLFAIGLSLEGLAGVIGPGHDAQASLRDRVEDVDRTIRQIRTSIFELRGPLVGARNGFRTAVLAVTAELSPVLGFSPRVAFSGPVDTLIVGLLTDDVIACMREAVTNVAKHAQARMVDVEVIANVHEVRLVIVDDGVGIPSGARRSGLDNLSARAEVRGGSFEIGSPEAGGTKLVWRAPIGD